jgi:hypothetical protein
MATTDLNDMLGIWERWTDGDLVLRHAVQSMGREGTNRGMLIDRVLNHLDRLMCRLTVGDLATSAALLAGWAVVLALGDNEGALAGMVHDIRRDAQEAHQYACAGRVPWKIG